MNKSIYPGSFDPFTNGHLSIVKEAAEIFDEVVILIANNPDKKRAFDIWSMKQAIEDILTANRIYNCKVEICDGLVAKYAASENIKYMIRGLRDSIDYNYEENIANKNHVINPELKCIYFRAEDTAISSSFVKELYKYGEDISPYVPYEILTILGENYA